MAQALEEVREQKLEILPPRDDTPRLSFGKGRLAQAMSDKVVFATRKTARDRGGLARPAARRQ